MMKSYEYGNKTKKVFTWDDIQIANYPLLKRDNYSFLNNNEYKRKNRHSKAILKKISLSQNLELVNFSIQLIKRADLAAYTNKILSKETDNKEVEVCEKKTSLLASKETELKKYVEEQYSPKSFTTVDIDPSNLVKLTSSIRGNISLFTTNSDEEEKCTEYKPSQTDYTEVDKEESLVDKIINADIVIFDVTKSRSKIIEVWNIIRAIRKILENNELPKSTGIKTFILISSLMTWSMTPELFSDPEFKLHENYYGLRHSHESFKPMHKLENEFLKLGYRFQSWLRVLVVSTGLIYGPGEEDLTPLLKLSLNEKIELPILGTGQNYVPIIHIDDLIGLLDCIVHNFPENYECIFAVEPELVTQNVIISLLCKSFGHNANSRIVDSKNYLMYNITDDEMFKMSANLPLESSYQKIVDWRNQYKFIQSMPTLARRYFSITRQRKPPCIVISGPPSQKVKNIVNNLNYLLGSVHLTPTSIVNSYSGHLGSNESSQRKISFIEKSYNEYTSLPRGTGLIKVLNRTFLEPRVQKNGYILEGFPETFKEAQLLEEILKSISENDARIFPNYDFDSSLTPDHYIILLTDEENILNEAETDANDKGAASAGILLSLINFTNKLSNEKYATEFFDEKKIYPKLIYIGEYKTALECAKYIHEIITNLPNKNDSIDHQKQYLSTAALLNMMLLTEEKSAPVQQTFKLNNELKVELNTSWGNNNENKADLNNGRSHDNSDNSPTSLSEKLSLKFPLTDEKSVLDKPNEPDATFYQTGIVVDKVSKLLKGTEGNASQCFLRNIKQQEINSDCSSSKVSEVTFIPNKRTLSVTVKEKKSCKNNRGERLHVKDSLSPIIEWTVVSKKILKGVVTGWCKITPGHQKVTSPDFVSFRSECSNKETTNYPQSISTSALPTQENNCKNQLKDEASSKASKIKESEVEDKLLTTIESFSELNPKLVRTNPLFKNIEINLYTNWYLFLTTGSYDIHQLKVFHKDNLSEEISFKECKSKERDSADIVMDNLRKHDLKIIPTDERKHRSIIKQGDVVQKLHRCCGKNEATNFSVPINVILEERDTNIIFDNTFDTNESISEYNQITQNEFSIDSCIDSVRLPCVKDPSLKFNVIHSSSESDACDMVKFNKGFDIPQDSSSNFVPSDTRRISEASNSGKSILKLLSQTSTVKKSSTSISRKVRFSYIDDMWSVKTFEEKLNALVEAHKEDLNENKCLKRHDPCSKEEGSETCPVYLFKNLLQQAGSDWRNEHLNSLLNPFVHRSKVVNFTDIQAYFEKYWSHFRTHPPELTLLPSSVMIQIEKNYICELLRLKQKKTIESLCNETFKREDSCVCNKDQICRLEKQAETVNQKIMRSTLGATSSFNIFGSSSEEKTDVDETYVSNQTALTTTIYTDCKRSSSWEPTEDVIRKVVTSNDSIIPLE